MATTVFISYSHVYAAQVERVKRGLGAEGVRVWIDHESLQPGTRSWELAIRQGIQASDVVVYMASPEALLSNNVQGELDVAESYHKPILPVWLAGDQWVHVVPMAMSKAQYIDARGTLLDAAIPRIAQSATRIAASASPVVADRNVRPTSGLPSPSADGEGAGVGPPRDDIAIPARLDSLGFAGYRDRKTGVAFIIPSVCQVPAGKFTMGSAQDDPAALDWEKPQYSIPVGEFEIGQYPLTVAEYALYLTANPSVAKPLAYTIPADAVWSAPAWRGKAVTWEIQQQQRADHPVVRISWFNARDYCRWLAQATGQSWRLPTEAEWEKAARWDTNASPPHVRIYPWGDQWDKARANTRDGGPGMTTPIGTYASKGDASPYGCHDMAGNVYEWTSTMWYDSPPYDYMKYDRNGIDISDNDRVLHGGSWYYDPRFARAAYRVRAFTRRRLLLAGVRLARGRAHS